MTVVCFLNLLLALLDSSRCDREYLDETIVLFPSLFEDLILVQDERWRHALSMQVERICAKHKEC